MKKKETFWKKLTRPTKIAGYNPETFKEKWGFKLNRIQMFSLFLFFTLVISGLIVVLLIFTPLGFLMPEGYSNPNKIKYEKALSETKALKKELETRDKYIESFRKVILGDLSIDSVYLSKPKEVSLENLDLDTSRSQNELNLASEINKSIQDNSFSNSSNINLDDLLFIDPVKGVISQGFDKKTHRGVDVSLSEGSAIKSVLGGKVLSSYYSEDDGYTLLIIHQDGFLSIYKHNKELLKNTGELVKKGETIAYSGNTGEHSSGPHLHFEIWQNDQPLNPLNLMSFK